MSKTGGYPPGCTQRHVDEAAPGYWDEPQEEGPEEERNLVQCDNCKKMFDRDEDEDCYIGPSVHGDTAQCGKCIKAASANFAFSGDF